MVNIVASLLGAVIFCDGIVSTFATKDMRLKWQIARIGRAAIGLGFMGLGLII